MLYWAIGVTLFAHCISFLSIIYFDQMGVIWYWLLAAISRVVCDEGENPERLTGEVSLESSKTGGPVDAHELAFK